MSKTSSSARVPAPSTPGCTIYSLCDDVLSTIFFFCIQFRLDHLELQVRDSLSALTSPWVLSYVCHHWREIVLSSPLLWTNIQLPISEYLFLPSIPLVPRRLELFLQRSGNLDLSVDIQDVQEEDYEDEEYGEIRRDLCFRSFLPLLLPTTTRWRHLNIAAYMDIFEAFKGYTFDRLQSLSVWQEEEHQLTLFQNTSSLTELTVEGQVDIILQWGGIQKFTASRCTIPSYLPRMVGLQILLIDSTDLDLDSFPSSFVLPALRSITMNVIYPDLYMFDFPRCLRAPELSTLILVIWNSPNSRPDVHSTHFPIFDTPHNLKNLSIDFLRFRTDDTVALLAKSPSVTTLYLGPEVATPAVIEALGLGILPRLTKLCLHFSTMEMYAEQILSMLESRTRLSVDAIAEISFARFRPCDEVTMVASPESGFAFLSREDLGLDGELLDRWSILRKTVDVYFVERHNFD